MSFFAYFQDHVFDYPYIYLCLTYDILQDTFTLTQGEGVKKLQFLVTFNAIFLITEKGVKKLENMLS